MLRLLLLLVLVAIALAVQAPAWLVGHNVQERSGGIMELRHTSGTIWNGQADAIVRGAAAGERDVSLGRVAWRVDRIDWPQRTLIVGVSQTPPAPRPATIVVGAHDIRLGGSVRVPAAIAGTIRLLAGWGIGGEVVIDTDALQWARSTGTGTATAQWHNATLVPPDLPDGFALGEVSARVALDGTATVVSVRNSGGDLELTGDASSRTRTIALLLQPRAGASSAQLAWLQSHTMGRTPRGYNIDAGWPGR